MSFLIRSLSISNSTVAVVYMIYSLLCVSFTRTGLDYSSEIVCTFSVDVSYSCPFFTLTLRNFIFSFLLFCKPIFYFLF